MGKIVKIISLVFIGFIVFGFTPNKPIHPEDYDIRKVSKIDTTDLQAKKDLDSSTIKRIMLVAVKRAKAKEDSTNNVIDLVSAACSLYSINKTIAKMQSRNEDATCLIIEKIMLKAEIEALLDNRERIKASLDSIYNGYADQISVDLGHYQVYLDSAMAIFRQIEAARHDAILLMSSEKYLKKLQREYGCDRAEAKKHQQVRIANIEISNYQIMTIAEIQSYRGELSYAIAYAVRGTNNILIAFDVQREKRPYFIQEVAMHEFLHKSTDSRNGISARASSLLTSSFEGYSLIDAINSWEIARTSRLNAYYSSDEERYVRFKALELDLYKYGLKDLGAPLTRRAYRKMMKLAVKDKLSEDGGTFIELTKNNDNRKGYRIFKKLFDKIA